MWVKHKYNIVSVDDIYSLKHKKISKYKNLCLITVDDGDKTFYDNIFPILIKHKTPAVLFVSPKIALNHQNFWFQEIREFDKNVLKLIISNYFRIDINIINPYPISVIMKNCKIKDIWEIINIYKKQNNSNSFSYNMSMEEILEVDKSEFVTIGAHTQNHPILLNEEDEVCKNEIFESIDILESELSHEINYFAYPNGIPNLDFGQREMSYLRQKGIRLAFSTQAKNLSYVDNPLSIPRFGLSFGNSTFVKVKLIFGRYWETIKYFKTPSEEYLRKELKSKVKFLK